MSQWNGVWTIIRGLAVRVSPRRTFIYVTLVAVFAVTGGPSSAQTSTCATTAVPTYYYDAGGRLSAVLGSTGGTSNYSYDTAGNILSVTSNAASTLQLLQVCPNGAPAGAAVTIWGTGLTGVQSVTFDGVTAATPTIISANEIIVTVPTAPSGLVAVHASGGTKATSLSSFNVGATAPTISGISSGSTFDPLPYNGATTPAVAAGTSATQMLTISGAGFDTTTPATSNKNKVWFGSQAASIVGTPTATSLTVAVPVSGSVSKNGVLPVITVSTPNGTATYGGSSVLVTPGGVSPYQINSSRGPNPANLPPNSTILETGLDSYEIDNTTDALTVGGAAQTLSFTTASATRFVAFIFAGSGGTVLNGQVSVCPSGSSCANGYTKGAVFLVAPDGSKVTAADLGGSYPPQGTATRQFFWKLPQTGTYTVFVQNALPTNSPPPTATVTLATVPPSQTFGPIPFNSSTSANVSGFQSQSATFQVPNSSTGRVTLTTSLASSAASPFLVSVSAPSTAAQLYSNQRPPQGDKLGFVIQGQIDFSGPITVQPGMTYTVNYQSLSAVASSVTFALNSLPNDVPVTGSGCASWPTSGSTATCSGSIVAPGQAIYATLTGAPPAAIETIQTASGSPSFTGCFQVILTDTGLNQQIYNSIQCGGNDFSYPVQFPTGSVGPYLLQGFGVGQNTGGLTFTLSSGPALAAIKGLKVGGSKTATFSAAGQTQEIVLQDKVNGLAGSAVTFSTSEPTGWTQCYVVAINAQQTSAPFATYLQCPTGTSGSLGTIQLPLATNTANPPVVTDLYDINITPVGGQLGSITAQVNAGTAPPAGTIPNNGSVYSTVSGSPSSYSYTFTPATGTAYVNLVSLPDIDASTGSSTSLTGCYEATLTQVQGGTSVSLFDSNNQVNGSQVSKNLGCSSLDVSAAIPVEPGPGTATFNLNNAAAAPTGTPTFGETLYNYNAVSSPTLTVATGGPAGVTLPSTLPGQPVVANISNNVVNQFVNIYVGMDASIGAYCSNLNLVDTTSNTTLFTDATCVPVYSTGAIMLPSATDSYQFTITPQGDAVGNITVGVSAQ